MAFRNADRFRRKIAQLPLAVQTAIRQAMEQTAQEIVQAMRHLVPVRTGKLRDSIGWCWGDPPAGARGLTVLTGAPANSSKFKISIFAGNYDAFYARWVEFGTKAHAAGGYRDTRGHKRNAGKRGHAATPAHPFFYPVWRAYKGHLRKAIAKILNKTIRAMKATDGG